MTNKVEQDLAAFYEEFVERPGIDKLIGAQERALLQATQGGASARIKYAAEDLAQNHGGPVVAGALATAVLANSAPVVAVADTGLVGRTGGTVAHSEARKLGGGSTQDQIVPLVPGEAIYNIAEVVAKEHGVSTAKEVHDIERASRVPSETEAEDLPVGFLVHIPPKNAEDGAEYIRVPLGSNLTSTAKENGLTLQYLLKLNPTYRQHLNFVEAGAQLRVKPATQTHEVSRTRPTRHHTQKPLSKTVITPTKTNSEAIPLQHKSYHPSKPKTETELPKTHAKRIEAPAQPTVKLASPVIAPKHIIPPHKAPAHAAIARTKTAPEHHSQPDHAPKTLNYEVKHIKTAYGIHSDVLTKSGLSIAALRYALEQMYGSPMASLADDFHALEQKFGINALYGAAAAAQESGGATSYLAKERNNLYGMNAVDSNPNLAFGYSSKAKSVTDFGELLYKDYLHPNGKYWDGSTLHGIYTKYSSSHDTEAGEIASIMNSLAQHGKYFYQTHHQASTPKHAADGPNFFHDFEHVLGETQAAVGPALVKPMEQLLQHTQSMIGHTPAPKPSRSPDKIKKQSHHTLGNAALYYTALKYNPVSYSETMIAGHESAKEWHINYPKISPKALLDCSGLVNLDVYTATGGRVDLNENTKGELKDTQYWQHEPRYKAGRGDLIEPVINGRVGEHVEIVNYVKGNDIYTFGAHTSQVPQPNQVGPAHYIYNPKDIFLRYIGPGAPLGGAVQPQPRSTDPAPDHKHPKATPPAWPNPKALAKAWNHPLKP